MVATSPTLDLAIELISRPSLCPQDAGCQKILARRLSRLGFTIEHMRFADVDNLWARLGDSGPLLAFAGHTDVVPSGPEEQWHSAPFNPEIRDGYLYGRGSADMKGSLAAMITACERVVASGDSLHGSLAFLLTSDEEGLAVDGTARVIEALNSRHEHIDWCLVGEPSSSEQVGDTLKIGRRGSLHGKLSVKGIQGHVAYPDLARNPVHQALATLDTLCNTAWDCGNEHFPATSFQISNITAGTGAENVIPGNLEIIFNFRFSTATTEIELKQKVESTLNDAGLDYLIEWRLSGKPFLTTGGELIRCTKEIVYEQLGLTAKLSTSGGTSDGRFIATSGTEVVELGPVNRTIHKINECVLAEDLDKLSLIYEELIRKLLANPGAMKHVSPR